MEDVDGLMFRPVRTPTAYGAMFASLWNAGDPFIVVEHDVVPWPGAIAKLAECPNGWCTHDYPLHRGNVTRSFGIGKYRPQGPAPEQWATTTWDQLDGQVIPVLNRLYRRPCVHEPPVAHCRREVAP
jgi:hypothetical protein